MGAASSDIGLYIHIPFCARKCRYCDFVSWSGMEDSWEPYINAVIKELEQKSEMVRQRRVVSIFLGGAPFAPSRRRDPADNGSGRKAL